MNYVHGGGPLTRYFHDLPSVEFTHYLHNCNYDMADLRFRGVIVANGSKEIHIPGWWIV